MFGVANLRIKGLAVLVLGVFFAGVYVYFFHERSTHPPQKSISQNTLAHKEKKVDKSHAQVRVARISEPIASDLQNEKPTRNSPSGIEPPYFRSLPLPPPIPDVQTDIPIQDEKYAEMIAQAQMHRDEMDERMALHYEQIMQEELDFDLEEMFEEADASADHEEIAGDANQETSLANMQYESDVSQAEDGMSEEEILYLSTQGEENEHS